MQIMPIYIIGNVSVLYLWYR